MVLLKGLGTDPPPCAVPSLDNGFYTEAACSVGAEAFHGNECSLNCDYGFLPTDSSIFCQLDGSWSNDSPSCDSK